MNRLILGFLMTVVLLCGTPVYAEEMQNSFGLEERTESPESHADMEFVEEPLFLAGDEIYVNELASDTVTVTFNTGGGSAVPSQTILKGGKVTKPGDPWRVGYDFAGWYKNKSCTTVFDFDTAVNKDTIVYAKWKGPINITVSFDTVGGSAVSSQSILKGDRVTRPSDPSRLGYDFIGWYRDRAFTEVFNFNESLYSDIVLYAKWDGPILIDVDFNTGGGPEITSQGVLKGSTIVEPKDPMRKGFYFIEWCTDELCTKPFDFDTPVYTNMTLFAKWKISSFGDIEVTLSSDTFVYNGKVKEPEVTLKIDSKKLIKGTDYDVKYYNNKNIGSARAVVIGIGEYAGEEYPVSFKIIPKAPDIKKIKSAKTSITFSWGKVKGADGYEVEVVSSNTEDVRDSKKTSVKIEGLESETTYYLRLRSYKDVDGKRWFSNKSNVKQVKTRK